MPRRAGVSETRCANAARRLHEASRGFTLIEILVVVVIVAVLAGTVAVSLLGSGGERQLERTAERLRALVAYACERAELSGREIGLDLTTSGYAFREHEGSEWRRHASDELRARRWDLPLQAVLRRDGVPVAIGAEPPATPPLVCFPSGEITPFRLDLVLPAQRLGYRLDVAAHGAPRLERFDVPR